MRIAVSSKRYTRTHNKIKGQGTRGTGTQESIDDTFPVHLEGWTTSGTHDGTSRATTIPYAMRSCAHHLSNCQNVPSLGLAAHATRQQKLAASGTMREVPRPFLALCSCPPPCPYVSRCPPAYGRFISSFRHNRPSLLYGQLLRTLSSWHRVSACPPMSSLAWRTYGSTAREYESVSEEAQFHMCSIPHVLNSACAQFHMCSIPHVRSAMGVAL